MITIASPIATTTRIDGVSSKSRKPSELNKKAGFLIVVTAITSNRARRMPVSRAFANPPIRDEKVVPGSVGVNLVGGTHA